MFEFSIYDFMYACKDYIENYNNNSVYKEIKVEEFKKLCIEKGRPFIKTDTIKEVMQLLSNAGMEIMISGDIIRYNTIIEDILVLIITQSVKKDYKSNVKLYFYDVLKTVVKKYSDNKDASEISSVITEWCENRNVFKAEIFNCISKYIIKENLDSQINCMNILEKWNDISATYIVTTIFWAISEYMNEIIVTEPKKQDIEAYRDYQQHLNILDRFIEYFIKLAKDITCMPAAYFAIELLACCPVIESNLPNSGKNKKTLYENKWKLLEAMLEGLECIDWSEILENVKPDKEHYDIQRFQSAYQVCTDVLKKFCEEHKTGTGKEKEALYYQRLCKTAMYVTYDIKKNNA